MADDYQADLGQYLRRRNIFDPKFPVVNDVPEMPASPQPQNSPGPGPAMSAYQQALAQKAPSMQDYHPGKLRSVLAAIAGGGTGMAYGAKEGIQAGEAVRNAPFTRQQSQYQENLKRLGAGAEAEVASGKESREAVDEARKGRLTEAQIGDIEEQRELRRKQVDAPRKWEPTTMAEEIAVRRATKIPQVEGPFTLETQDGKKIEGAIYDRDNRSYIDQEGNKISAAEIKNARKFDQSTHEPSLYGDERQKLIDKYGSIEKVPLQELQNLKVNEFQQQNQANRESEAQQKKLEGRMRLYYSRHANNFKNSADRLNNIRQTSTLLKTGDAKSVALMAPSILKDIIGGQGSNIRITMAEINKLESAKGLKEGVEAFVNRISNKGNISDSERQQYDRILSEAQILYQKKLDKLYTAMENIRNADDMQSLNEAESEALKAEMEDMSEGIGQKKPEIKLKLVKP